MEGLAQDETAQKYKEQIYKIQRQNMLKCLSV